MPLVIEQQFMDTVIRELPKISKSLETIANRDNTDVTEKTQTRAEEYWANEVRFFAKENDIRISDTIVADVVDAILYHDDILWERINECILAHIEGVK